MDFGSIGEIYGAHALWKISLMSHSYDVAVVAAVTAQVQFSTYENDGNTGFRAYFASTIAAGTYGAAMPFLPLVNYFRGSDFAAQQCLVIFIANNIVGNVYQVAIQGTIHDERMI
jgi:hypothetical protein